MESDVKKQVLIMEVNKHINSNALSIAYSKYKVSHMYKVVHVHTSVVIECKANNSA